MPYPRLARTVGLVLTAGLLAACGGGGGDPLAGSSGEQAPDDTIVVGSANFSENIILAEIYAQALEEAGVKTEKKLNIGSRETYIPALQDGSIDLIPEYTGNLLLYFDSDAKVTKSDEVYEALQQALPEGLVVLEKSSAEDKDVLVVRQETAEKYDLETIADLQRVDDQLVVGGSPEFAERRAGLKGLQEVYGLDFKEFKTLDAGGPLTVTALKDGDVDVTQLFSTQPSIEQNNFVPLEDPKNIHIAQNIVPLANEDKVTPTVRETLNAVSAELTTEKLAELVKRVDIDKENPRDVAADWLQQADLN
ncbi:MAG TPA: ABC transporter substrate-binding protein [Nocardioidaceae bacterium]|nr:ABC transporter substrate-binding protein [Nocardioidaceae bacterium]